MYEKYIPDCFWPRIDNGNYCSHEAVCILNCTKVPAHIKIILYFEDREPLKGITFMVDAQRTRHARMDKILEEHIEMRGIPYAMCIQSDVKVHIQYTRVDTTQAALALATCLL